jgi:hypothetical protein
MLRAGFVGGAFLEHGVQNAFVAVNPDYSMRCPFFYRQSQRAANQPHSGYCDCEFFHLFTLS